MVVILLIKHQTRIKHKGEDLSAIFSDYNNDGYVDLHICNNTGNKIYENFAMGNFSKERVDS